MSDAISIISEPLVQYGAIGVVLAYALVTDWIARKNQRKDKADAEEAQRKRDEAQEVKEEQREKDCVARIRQLEERQMRFMQTVSLRTNNVLEEFTQELRRHNINLKTPLPDIVTPFDEDETRAIPRKAKNEH